MKARAIAFIGTGLLASIASRPVSAQQGGVIDVGLAVAQFTDPSAVAYGPFVGFSQSGGTGRLVYSLSAGGLLTPGATTGSATASTGVRGALSSFSVGELGVEGSGVTGSTSGGAVGTGLLQARTLFPWKRGGAWLRGEAQAAQRLHSSYGGGAGEVGAWWQAGAMSFTGSVVHERTSAELYTQSFHRGYAGLAPVNYSDARLGMHSASSSDELDVSFALRRDKDAEQLWERGYSVQFTQWNGSGTMGFTVRYAKELNDWVHGADAMNMGMIGMRVRGRANVSRATVSVGASDAEGVRTVRVQVLDARSVDVMGDFSDWTARPLTLSGRDFVMSTKLASGPHRIVVRIDGGEWKPAANTPSVDDEFGGKAGVFVVP